MVSPVMTAAEARSHGTFLALLWALSNPGRVESLPDDVDDALVAVADVLIDLETSFFSPDAALVARLARTGARRAPSDVARYQFYRRLERVDLSFIESMPIGSHLYPDDAATVVVGCTFGVSTNSAIATDQLTLLLTGPGIKGSADIHVSGVSREFWTVRQKALRYPLGWDLFLVEGKKVVGIPRTTEIRVQE